MAPDDLAGRAQMAKATWGAQAAYQRSVSPAGAAASEAALATSQALQSCPCAPLGTRSQGRASWGWSLSSALGCEQRPSSHRLRELGRCSTSAAGCSLPLFFFVCLGEHFLAVLLFDLLLGRDRVLVGPWTLTSSKPMRRSTTISTNLPTVSRVSVGIAANLWVFIATTGCEGHLCKYGQTSSKFAQSDEGIQADERSVRCWRRGLDQAKHRRE